MSKYSNRSGMTRVTWLTTRTLLTVLVALASLTGCATAVTYSEPPSNASESFSTAVNSRDIEATMAHFSEDAILILHSEVETAEVSRDEIRANYEKLFQEETAPNLEIRVEGIEGGRGIAHEWGSFKVGDSAGCYVLVRRGIDNWKIYREWIVQPCGETQ